MQLAGKQGSWQSRALGQESGGPRPSSCLCQGGSHQAHQANTHHVGSLLGHMQTYTALEDKQTPTLGDGNHHVSSMFGNTQTYLARVASRGKHFFVNSLHCKYFIMRFQRIDQTISLCRQCQNQYSTQSQNSAISPETYIHPGIPRKAKLHTHPLGQKVPNVFVQIKNSLNC